MANRLGEGFTEFFEVNDCKIFFIKLNEWESQWRLRVRERLNYMWYDYERL